MEAPIWLNKYAIIKKLGQGGSGEVFLAEHTKLMDLRAIKRIKKDNPLHNQLLLEASILKNLSHPCIPTIFDMEEDEEYSYIIEQYMNGETLKEYLESKKHLSENLIISIGIQICDLFLYMYSCKNPILYLDLQPANIIIDNGRVKLIDFGSAIFRDKPDTRIASFGTEHFAPPELYSKTKPDERADIYGIGALLYYMVYKRYNIILKKKYRFVRNIENSYSKKLNHIIRQCMRYDSIFRIPTVAALKNKLLKLNRKDNGNQISNKSLTIAVAGAQQRIGVTHLSILLTSYLDSIGVRSQYIEANDSGHMLCFLDNKVSKRSTSGKLRVNNCNISLRTYLCNETKEYQNEKEIQFTKVFDYGLLSHENKLDFLEADIKVVLVGGKEWEVEYKNKAMALVGDCKDVIYLYNFLDGYQYSKQAKEIPSITTARIPYVPNPFYHTGNETVDDFLCNLLATSENGLIN